MTLGYMSMPANFRYKDVFMKGRPQHQRWDPFAIKHPPMSSAKWAKIFSPFDALKEFDEAIGAKEVQYVSKVELSDEAKDELGRRLGILRNLTWNNRMARSNRVAVSVKYFVPCPDENSFFFGTAGTYETAIGIVLNVDTEIGRTITLQTDTERKVVDLDDILEIESKTDVFTMDWELETP